MGIGPGYPAPVAVFLKESDQIGFLVDCPWSPIDINAGGIMFGISFVLEGYYLDKELFNVTQDNMNT